MDSQNKVTVLNSKFSVSAAMYLFVENRTGYLVYDIILKIRGIAFEVTSDIRMLKTRSR